MLSQGTGGSVTTITAALADNPMAGVPASIPMITKGGLDAVTISLASEYAKNNIRFNAVAPGVVDTPLHKNNPKGLLESLSPMGSSPTRRKLRTRSFILRKLVMLPGRCCTWTAVRTWAGGKCTGALSHSNGRWALHLLPGSGAEGCSHYSIAARSSVLIADVSAAVDEARRRLPLGRS